MKASGFLTLAAFLVLAALIAAKWAGASVVPVWDAWQPPAWWARQAACIHRYETFGLPPASWASWHDTRNPESRGGMQFIPSTWRSVGGTGDPARATRQEQLYRAWLLYLASGRSWSQWTTAKACGLR